ncbi:hypothetical protein EDB85DRAFT_2162140 [Lactarius pseudohatsudake]|nr:hypothetical protein EDB85DRAFT_2162140 [Lactarius pseudohatsudake]
MQGRPTLIYIGIGDSPHNDVVLNTAKESPRSAARGFHAERVRAERQLRADTWTFAKQKWQRTKGARIDDEGFRTAQILPGFREQIYA